MIETLYHQRKWIVDGYECKMCGFTTKSFDEMKMHLYQMHMQPIPWTYTILGHYEYKIKKVYGRSSTSIEKAKKVFGSNK